MRKKILIISIIGILVFWIIIFILMPSGEEIISLEINQNLQEEYIGIVTANYYDIKEHNYRTTIIATKDGYKKIRHIRDISGLFEYLMVGDSIWKDKGSMEVEVKRNDSTKIFKINIPLKE